MIKLIDAIDSLIVDVESMILSVHPLRRYAFEVCIIHLRIARSTLNSIR